MDKSKRGTVLLVINIVACLILTVLAVYGTASTSQSKGLLSYPEWVAPLVYMVATLLFAGSKFQSVRHTAVGLGMLLISGILLLVPVPDGMSETIKWWYPISAALIVNVFINLGE